MKVYKTESGSEVVVASKLEDAAEAYNNTRGKDPVGLTLLFDDENVIVSAEIYSLTTFVDTAPTADNCKAYPESTTLIAEGSTVSLTAVNGDTLSFVKWQNKETLEELSTEPVYVFTMTKDIIVEAVFA